MTNNKSKKKIEAEDVIPAFPSVIVEINRIIDLPDTDYNKLSRIIEKDPAICARILKIVNSAFYGMSSQVASIPDAVSVLGFDTVHRIALTISVVETVKQGKNPDNFDYKHLWKHLFFTAAINRHISIKFKTGKPDEAYITGLMHDIGKFILFYINPGYYLKIQETVKKQKVSFSKAEELVARYPSHSRLGAFAAKTWKFPANLTDAIKYHHNYSANASSKKDLLLIMISNYIDNHKEIILNAGINTGDLHPEVVNYFKQGISEINFWLPEILESTENEFKTFAENLK
ncbi:MAG: HDOD domain-containing protein [Thermodesulfobacteriota bacterium]